MMIVFVSQFFLFFILFNRLNAFDHTEDHCQNDSDCENNGKCLLNNFDAKFCSCQSGFKGKTCSQTCSIQCVNNGRCVDESQPEGEVCLCPAGYSGGRCEIKKTCMTKEDCNNHGFCQILSDQPDNKCFCNSGFMGRHCEMRCQYSCLNGGQCEYDPEGDGSGIGGSIKCVCPTPFSGGRCEVRSNETSTNVQNTIENQKVEEEERNGLMIALLVIGGVFIVAVVGYLLMSIDGLSDVIEKEYQNDHHDTTNEIVFEQSHIETRNEGDEHDFAKAQRVAERTIKDLRYIEGIAEDSNKVIV